jgi:galactokinase
MKDPAALSLIHEKRYHAVPQIFAAPGRVNLIGEHTDYAEGFVMPAPSILPRWPPSLPRDDGKW